MSARAHPATRATTYRRRSLARRRTVRRRRSAALLGAALLAGLAFALAWPSFHHAVREIALPLRHEDIIRQQARDKGLDPALIAAVIYAESRFRDGQTSHAGALGLMQITPATARMIAHKSGGTAFVVGDLATPQVNIAYGAWYLRYNGGEGNVDRWIGAAEERAQPLTIRAIPFSETRTYVQRVERAKLRYRRSYARELGL